MLLSWNYCEEISFCSYMVAKMRWWLNFQPIYSLVNCNICSILSKKISSSCWIKKERQLKYLFLDVVAYWSGKCSYDVCCMTFDNTPRVVCFLFLIGLYDLRVDLEKNIWVVNECWRRVVRCPLTSDGYRVHAEYVVLFSEFRQSRRSVCFLHFCTAPLDWCVGRFCESGWFLPCNVTTRRK